MIFNHRQQFENKISKIFFFAGAGISRSSYVPDVPSMLAATIETFLPKEIDSLHKEKILKLQPEIIYEAIIRLTGSRDSLNLWEALHPGKQVASNLECKPNIAHLFVVYHANVFNLPIFTTNFDVMFEKAADALKLKYRVYLPGEQPPPHNPDAADKEIAICKLHGSIMGNGDVFAPDALMTTMTEITRLNTKWLDYIRSLFAQQLEICFIGYSGRDIDLFPQIRKYALRKPEQIPGNNDGRSAIFWINKFVDDKGNEDPSYRPSLECNAKRIEDIYPSDLFNEMLATGGGWLAECKKQTDEQDMPKGDDAERMLAWACTTEMITGLKSELLKKISLDIAVKNLLYAELVAKSGLYLDAHVLIGNYSSQFDRLPAYQFCESLLFRARQSHELSKYETCYRLAKQALAEGKKLGINGLDIRIQARCLISESLRMLLPNDTYFKTRKSAGLLHAARTLFNFQLNQSLNIRDIAKYKNSSVHLNKDKSESESSCSVHSIHEMIEHDIRKTALIQGMTGNPFSGWRKQIRQRLIKQWLKLRDKSKTEGYAGGIANTAKFMIRLESNKEALAEMDMIYDLCTHVTGKELSSRNKADEAIKQKNWEGARKYLDEYLQSSRASGNRLNSVKALIGHMYVNQQESGQKYLLPEHQGELNKLISQIEGEFWQRHLRLL